MVSMKTTSRLRSLLAQPGLIVAPGAADALTARLVQRAGFSVVYITGAGIANSQFGLPDLGLLGMTEVLEQVERITRAIDVPAIADADTGYGNPLNVLRTIREFERAGVAGIQLEDQVNPKRCGHFSGKEVVAAEEMVQKLRAAVSARQDPDLVLVARTDALATHGVDEAIVRARLYAANGADVIFIEAPTTRAQIEALPRQVPAPLLFNMTEGGRTPALTNRELQEFGYKVVIYPNTLLRVGMRAVQDALGVLHSEGSTQSLLPRMVGWEERQQIVELAKYQELDETFVRSMTETPPDP